MAEPFDEPKQVGELLDRLVPERVRSRAALQNYPASLRRGPRDGLRVLISGMGLWSFPHRPDAVAAGRNRLVAVRRPKLLCLLPQMANSAALTRNTTATAYATVMRYTPAPAVKINTAAEAFGRFSAMNAPPAATIDARTASIPRQTATLDSSEPNVIPDSPKFRTAAPPTIATAPPPTKPHTAPIRPKTSAPIRIPRSQSSALLLRPPTQVGSAGRGGLVQPRIRQVVRGVV